MMIMRRSVDYTELLGQLRGKKVAIWTCDTCARLCNGIGGKASATALMERLVSDGIEVTGVLSTSASCIMSKVSSKYDPEVIDGCDVILALTCDVGSMCAEIAFDKDSLNPIETLGPGCLDDNMMPILGDGRVVMMGCDPFI